MPNLDPHEASPRENSILFNSEAKKQKTLAELTKIFIHYRNKQGKLNSSYTCEAIEDSNMNLVLRISIDGHYWLIKHADPWVRKYPSIPAPVSRTKQEANFYKVFGKNPKLKNLMPEYLGFEARENILALEYIEHASSGMNFYCNKHLRGIPENLFEQAISYLTALHSENPCDSIDWSNQGLRNLNHLHMFEFPFDPANGIDLNQFCPGLAQLGHKFQRDLELKKACSVAGTRYLHAQGPMVLHGDFYPGSWLIKGEKLFIIDPEFCFLGPAEFDLGVLLAHNLIIGSSMNKVDCFIDRYKQLSGSATLIDRELCLKFCGVEILRRILGAAQLPINWPLSRYEAMLNLGRKYCVQ
ncbi:MAG: phosphotransferase [Oligoflexales bacterium]